MHIELADDRVAALDAVAGPRGRSAFVRRAIELAIDQERRWAELESAAGTLAGSRHAWDADTASWVRDQRHADSRRAG